MAACSGSVLFGAVRRMAELRLGGRRAPADVQQKLIDLAMLLGLVGVRGLFLAKRD